MAWDESPVLVLQSLRLLMQVSVEHQVLVDQDLGKAAVARNSTEMDKAMRFVPLDLRAFYCHGF